MLKRLHFQSCINCGSLFVTPSQFCKACSSLLLNNLGAKSSLLVQNIPTTPLLIWPPGKSDSLSYLILNMKKASYESWRFYAKSFLIQHPDLIGLKNVTLLSHQSTSGNRHAWNWAQSLSEFFGYSHIEALKLNRYSGPQKTLSLSQRENRSMAPLVEISSLRDQNLVFVDDVVTTGFTALAAYKALGRPKNYRIWCLALRPASTIAVN